MALSKRLIPASPEHIFTVLSDPPRYASFVVGTKAIRRFDPRFPETNSAFHHTLGLGPFVLRDETRVIAVEPPTRLVLKAFMRPFSINEVDFRLTPHDDATLVVVEEHPIEGPAKKVWSPPLEAALWLRNKELLRRLERLAKRQAEQAVMGKSPNAQNGPEPAPSP